MSDQLKPCPFCGVLPIERDDFGGVGLFLTSCENPKCGIHPYRVGKTREECTIKWNLRTAEQNEPLTLEQLRGMDGCPVYCVGFGNKGLDGFGLVNVEANEIVDSQGDSWDLDDYNETFIAYLRKPEELP
jgi:hypothetical protein